MLHVKVIRKLASLSYLRDPSAGAGWQNNDANNGLDDYTLYDDDTEIITSKVQTVANLEGLDSGVHFYDTLAPGKFGLRFGVDPRQFKCQPLGVVGAITKRGDRILEETGPDGLPTENDSTTLTNKSRWLEHDRKNHADPPEDTRGAWSAGCIVHINDDDLVQINKILSDRGLQPGALIPAELFEESES